MNLFSDLLIKFLINCIWNGNNFVLLVVFVVLLVIGLVVMLIVIFGKGFLLCFVLLNIEFWFIESKKS